MEKTLVVEGMMCMHCVAHVEKALSGVDGVSAVKVDLKSGLAKVSLTKDVDQAVFAQAIDKAGYHLKAVK